MKKKYFCRECGEIILKSQLPLCNDCRCERLAQQRSSSIIKIIDSRKFMKNFSKISPEEELGAPEEEEETSSTE